MPYRRFSRRRYRRGYRRPYYRRRFSTFRRRVKSGSVTTRSRMRVKIPIQQAVNFLIPNGANISGAITVCPWWNTTRVNSNTQSMASAQSQCLGITGSILYNTYANLFDEVKVDGVKVSINLVDAIGQGGSFSAIRIGSVVDRRLTRTDGHPNFAEMQNWSSFYNRIILNNGQARQRRAVWASDLNERIMFVDSDMETGATPPGTYLQAMEGAAGYNPSFFSPAIHFALQTPTTNNTGTDIAIAALVDYTVWCTFRNPKCSVTSISKAREMDRLDIDAQVEMSDEKKVTDEDEAFEPPAKQSRQVTIMTSE